MKVLYLISVSILVVSFSSYNADAQIDPCFNIAPLEELSQKFEDFSQNTFENWELKEYYIDECFGTGYATYEVSPFSSEDTIYLVNINVPSWCYSDSECYGEFAGKEELASEQIKKLQSKKIFEEISEKLHNKEITMYLGGDDFEILAENDYGIPSQFTFDDRTEYLQWGNFTNDIELNSSKLFTKTKYYLEYYLQNTNSECKIKSCDEESCGKTVVGRSPYVTTSRIFGYGGIFELEGDMCPSESRVTLTKNYEFFSITHFYSNGTYTERPLIVVGEQDISVLDLGYDTIEIPYTINHGKINQTEFENNSIKMKIDISNYSMVYIDISKLMSLIDKGSESIDNIHVLQNGKEKPFTHSVITNSLIIGFPMNSDTYIEIMADNLKQSNSGSILGEFIPGISNFDKIPSPNQQMKHGVLKYSIICKDNFKLIFKSVDHSPACVKPSTAEKLIKRGWSELVNYTTDVIIPQGTSLPNCELTKECYFPFEIVVDVGDVVTWSNDDIASHTVTSGSPSVGPSGVFDSSLILGGATYSFSFGNVGEFPYYCVVHPWMEGNVIVKDVSRDPVSFLE